jgi:probable HAF family extracellular repeat protein
MNALQLPGRTGLAESAAVKTASTAPPPVEDVTPPLALPARRPPRNTSIALRFLGALVVIIPPAVGALVSEAPQSPGTVSPATAVTTPAQSPQAGTPVWPSAQAALPRSYDAVRLAGLSGSTEHPTLGFALNEAGQAVGQSDTSDGHAHPVLWQNGKVIDLGVLLAGTDGELGVARDINNRGDIVGASNALDGQHAVLWRNGQIIDLGMLNGNPTFAYAINDNGQIVGTSHTPAGELRGFLWDNGQMRDLGIDGGVMPRDINNRGQVVGSLDFGESGAGQRAFLWENGVTTRLQAPGIASSAEKINDRGEIAGQYILDAERGAHPVRWYQGSMTELGLLGNGTDGGAHAINEQGQILGTSNVAPHSLQLHAFLWWRGVKHDLTTAGVPTSSAYDMADINNRGQILAGAMLFTPRN